MTDTDTSSFDLIIVGSGIAGLSAAVTGAQLGQRVAVIERAPEGEHGGNTRYTEAYSRMKSMDEVADDFESHFAENAGGYPDPGILQEAALDYESWSSLMRAMCIADPDIIDAFARAAGPTLRWLESAGVTFDFLPTAFLTTTTTRLLPVGGGLALVEALTAAAKDAGVTFMFSCTANSLVTEADGTVVGVHLTGPHASELIGEGVLAIEMGATLEDLALAIHAHPTLSEQWGEAADLALGRPLHMSLAGGA